MVSFSVKLYVLFSAFFVVEGTLTPDGPVSLDCGSQQTFICSVTDGPAAWVVGGLNGISITADTGRVAASNARITTTDIGAPPSSTINITGFNTSDNGGTIQCIDLSGPSIQGMANISVGVPSCPSSVMAVSHDDSDAIIVTWQQSPNTPPVTSTTVTFCTTSLPNCVDSVTCTSPCTINGLHPGTEYQFTVIPKNHCGSPTGCTGNTATVETACICLKYTSQPSSPVEVLLLAGIIPTVVLLLANLVTGVVVFLVARHCYKKTSQKSSHSKGEDIYEQVEGPTTCEDITMIDSPAYSPVK